MRKLSDIKGEEAIEVLSEIVEPLFSIFSDAEVQEIVKAKKPYVLAVKPALKGHKKEVLHIMATLEGKPDAEYAPNLLELPAMLIDFFNDPEVQTVLGSLFTSGSQELASTGSAPENIEASNE